MQLTDDQPQCDGEDIKETGRIEAFSDGVFSIALTLLVLELKVPGINMGQTSGALWVALAAQWPGYLAFVTSFFSILIMWVNHHSIFRLVRRCNGKLLFANGLLLLLVTAVPFPTALVTTYLTTPAASVACAVYCALFVAVSIAYGLVLIAACSDGGRLVTANAWPEIRRRIRDCYFVGTPLYSVATAAAFVRPWISMGIVTLLWVFWSLRSTRSASPFCHDPVGNA